MTDFQMALPGLPDPPPGPEKDPDALPHNEAFQINLTIENSASGFVNVLDYILSYPDEWKRTVRTHDNEPFGECVSAFIYDSVDHTCDGLVINDDRERGLTVNWYDELEVDYRLKDEMLAALKADLINRRLWDWDEDGEE